MQSRTIFFKALALIILTLSLNQQVYAQINLYSYTPLSGLTYTPISSGTVINTNAGLTTGTQDDGAVLVSLPFTFTYDNIGYNQVTFCTNGWVGMGNQTATGTIGTGRAASSLFTSAVPNNTIAAFFGDGGANFPTGSGSMVHGLIGTDVYAFEWRNACGLGFTQTTTNLINYMIVIYGPGSSSPGRIELLYGATSGSSPSTSRSLGIEDGVGGTGHYINALNGSTSSTTTNSAWMGNGNGYRFDPPPPCSGTPLAGSISAPATVCPTSFTMSLTGTYTVGPGIVYQWQSKPSTGTTFTNLGTNSPSLTTSITVPTDFRCVVTCTPSAQSATTATVSIGINSFYECYCKTGLGGSTAGPSIDSVNILQTTLNHAAPGVAPGAYTQNAPTGDATADIQAGGLYYIYVKYGGNAIGSAWMDFNRNGNYETNEWVQINTSGGTGLAIINVPSTAVNGLTGLRIRSASAASTNNAGSVCANFSSGETEDYIVNIVAAPANDLRVITLLNPPAGNPGICPFTEIPVKVVIYNNGSNAQNGFSITANLTGAATASNSITYSGVLPAFTSDTVTVTNYNFNVTGSFNTRAFISGGVDNDHSNDTSANYPFHILFTANLPLVHSDSVCYGETALLTLRSDTVKHNWYTTATGTVPFYVGDSLAIPNVQKDTVLYVSSIGTKQSGSLSTTNAGGNGCGGGVMFDVVPNANLSIDSFAAVFANTGSQSVNVYYRVGTFAGSETNSSAWTLLGTATVNPASTSGYTIFTVNTPLLVSAGNTYGIYINYDATYTSASASTPFSNPDLLINAGTGLCSAFGGTNANRVFNGTVYYSKGSNICESPKQVITAYAGPKPLVNLGPDLSACEDLDLILDAGFAGGAYLWNTGEVNQTITIRNRPGTYWVDVDKYCTATDTVVVTVDPLPSVSGISYKKIGNQYQFAASDAKYIKSFKWIFGDGTTDASTLTPTHIYADDKPYTVRLVMYNDCGGDSVDLVIPLGIQGVQTNNAAITLYPNPATEKLTIDIQGSQQPADVMIVNNIGIVVFKQNAVGNGKTDIDVSRLPAGNYILRYSNDDNNVSKPFVITR